MKRQFNPSRVPLVFVALLTLLATLSLGACSQNPATPPGDTNQTVLFDFDRLSPMLEIGPIPGLTEGWHAVPMGKPMQIPSSTRIELFCRATPDQIVGWTGAQMVRTDERGSYAVCPTLEAGPMVVEVNILSPDGRARREQCRFQVLSTPVELPEPTKLTLAAENYGVRPGAANEETMRAFFGSSVAELEEVGEGHYVTSIEKELKLGSDSHSAYGHLQEWFVNGKPAYLGAEPVIQFDEVGTYEIQVGSKPGTPKLRVDTYETMITSHVSNHEIVPSGSFVTYRAETNPRGYEDRIRWVSSTSYGTATPSTGVGPTFTVLFEETWNDEGHQWLGVKADNTIFNQDQKCPCDPPSVTYSLSDPNDAVLNTALTVVGDDEVNWTSTNQQDILDINKINKVGETVQWTQKYGPPYNSGFEILSGDDGDLVNLRIFGRGDGAVDVKLKFWLIDKECNKIASTFQECTKDNLAVNLNWVVFDPLLPGTKTGTDVLGKLENQEIGGFHIEICQLSAGEFTLGGGRVDIEFGDIEECP